jgi:hypothetical protein
MVKCGRGNKMEILVPYQQRIDYVKKSLTFLMFLTEKILLIFMIAAMKKIFLQ